MSDRTIHQILSDLRATLVGSNARIAAILAQLRSLGAQPKDEPPPPFRPAVGTRPPPLPADPLDARSKAAA
jgi:hypothetical protein